MEPIIQTIKKNIRESRNESPINKEIYTDNEVFGKNEFLFFIKPEITLDDENINFSDIVKLVLKKIESFSIKIKNIRIVNAAYLAKHNIIAKHYGVINMLSRNIRAYASEEAKSNFEKIFGISFEDSEVWGSLEFLEKYPHFTPTGLSFLWQNAATEKIAGGTYVQKLTLDGQTVFIVNGFHPRQLEHFTAKDRCIVTMTLVGDISWKEARNSFVGKTNPGDALPGSIRHELLINKEKFGLHSVSSSWNGVHLSAGPVEGLVELMRYNSDYEHSIVQSAQDYTFGLKLAEKLENSKAEKLLKNPIVQFNNKLVSIFDLTEETDSDECLEILKELI
jgi:hypothetical protein